MKLIEIGKVVRSQGLKGRIKVLSYMQSPDVLEGVTDLFVGATSADAKHYQFEVFQPGGGLLVLKLQGVDNRDDADRLKGRLVWADAEKMKPLEEDEYYWSDIIGLEAVNEKDEPLGRIASIFPTGSNDVYVCKNDNREILLPAVASVIQKIDLKRGVIVVSLPEGCVEP